MKAFWFSTLALVALCGIVIWNGITVSRISDDMSEIASGIESLEDEEALRKLEEIWHEHRLILSISVPHRVTDELDRTLVLLRKKFDEGISTEIPETVALAIKSIEELRTHSLVDANNILFINNYLVLFK
ncbi:MAG: DUF4363 family protein [Ruminococcaceae bacterium]|nr:DUF4363 family protein [Oscillospiraceae bacterium]